MGNTANIIVPVGVEIPDSAERIQLRAPSATPMPRARSPRGSSNEAIEILRK